MTTIYALIEQIRIRPGMYLSKPNITNLLDFLNGYNMALYEYSICTEKTLLPLPFWFFHEYVARKYGYYESTSGWTTMILDQTRQDEEQGLATFFILFDEFKSLSIKHCSIATLKEMSNMFHTNDFCETYSTSPVYENATNIYLIELYFKHCYLFLVETKENFILERQFFKSRKPILEYVKQCFGENITWNEHKVDTIFFDKALEL